MSRRLVHALDLVDDAALIETYERRHAPGAVWPEVVNDLRQRGVLAMEIWRLDQRMVMIAEVEDDYPRGADPALQEQVSRWEAEMDAFQRPLRAEGPKWVEMRRIFSLADQ